MYPAFLYHRISEKPLPGATWLTPHRFQAHINYLKKANFNTTTLDVGNDLDVESETVTNKILITFDDGLECIHKYAYPVMENAGFKGVIFIPSGFIGQQNNWDYQFLGHAERHMNREMLSELIKSGWQIGSHTVSHRALTMLNPKEIKAELELSKKQLEDMFGDQVNWVSFPFGRYNKQILNTAYEAGYLGFCSHVDNQYLFDNPLMVQNARGMYLWDSVRTLELTVKEWHQAKGWRKRQKIISYLSGGTIIWRRFFPKGEALDSLAKMG